MQHPRVILVDILEPQTTKEEAEKKLVEMENLVNTYGGLVVVKVFQKKQKPDYKTYIGAGKLDEVIAFAEAEKVDIIICNNILKSKQIYNITEKVEKKGMQVWDRMDLILKIFDKHASSAEAKLQIELAAIKHMGPRIFGMGMELSRQGGGIGTRGKGETNTEIMKRHLANQEKKIKEKLKKSLGMKEQQRSHRLKHGWKNVAIVGYTNAGKSQLLTSLTKKKVKVQDELFATLDTRIGELYLPAMQSSCLISDTIGFIQDLPHELIDAFTSTLNEAIHADLLLHVVDFSDTDRDMKIQVVREILEELGAGDIPTVLVANKIDLVKKLQTKTFEKRYKKYSPVFISALEKKGLDDLLESVESHLGE